jgi:hypothetical protein
MTITFQSRTPVSSITLAGMAHVLLTRVSIVLIQSISSMAGHVSVSLEARQQSRRGSGRPFHDPYSELQNSGSKPFSVPLSTLILSKTASTDQLRALELGRGSTLIRSPFQGLGTCVTRRVGYRNVSITSFHESSQTHHVSPEPLFIHSTLIAAR